MPRQFQLRTLLIAIALCALGTWWVNWPRQTAQWFATEGYKAISPDDEKQGRALFRQMFERDPSRFSITPRKRSWYDCLVGKQSFSLKSGGGRFHFEVVRGQVTAGPDVYGWGHYIFDVF